MSFNIGDRVHPISDSDFDQFGEGTIVSKYDMGGYYINWDNANDHTYPYTFRDNGIARTYDNVYMLFDDRFELVDVNIAINKPPLPSDPRLRGICLKIRELDRKFKQRQEAKKDIPFEEAAQRAYDAYTTTSGTFGTTIAQVEGQPVQYTPMYLNTVRTTY